MNAANTHTEDENLITIEELSGRLSCSVSTARGLYRRKVIPGMKLGHRTLRFSYPEVIEALRHYEASETV
jgi:excisionase family DNA binding protein